MEAFEIAAHDAVGAFDAGRDFFGLDEKIIGNNLAVRHCSRSLSTHVAFVAIKIATGVRVIHDILQVWDVILRGGADRLAMLLGQSGLHALPPALG